LVIEGIVKSEEEIAEAEVVVAVLFASSVFRDARSLEPNPAVAHVAGRSNAAPFQHRQHKIQQSQNRFASAYADAALVHPAITCFNAEPLAIGFKIETNDLQTSNAPDPPSRHSTQT